MLRYPLLLLTYLLFSKSLCLTAYSSSLLQKAETLLQNGDQRAAVPVALMAVEERLTPATVQVANKALTWCGRYAEAEKLLVDTLDAHGHVAGFEILHKELGILYNYYGARFDGLGDTERIMKVVKHFQLYIKFFKEDVGVLNDLGIALSNLGRSQEAAAAYQQILEYVPNDYRALTNLGLLFSAGHFADVDKALSYMRKAYDLVYKQTVTDPAAQELLSVILLNTGSAMMDHVEYRQEGLKILRQAVEIDPWKSALAMDILGNNDASSGRITAAKVWYRKAISAAERQNDTDLAAAIMVKSGSLLPRIYNSSAEVIEKWWAYVASLQRLLRRARLGELHFKKPDRAILDMGYYLVYGGIGNRQPREMLAEIFSLACPSLNGRDDLRSVVQTQHHEDRPSGVLHLGFFSEYFFRDHSTRRLLGGVIRRLASAKKRFQVYIIVSHRSPHFAKADAYFHSRLLENAKLITIPGMVSMESSRSIIRQLALDILIFAELGMGALAWLLSLAGKSLAKKTMTFWGHGVTS